MVETLRHLILQQGARLQERPALTCPEWGTLSYMALRNRVEGLALGLAAADFPDPIHCATGTPWDWVAELATAACGLRWSPDAPALDPAFLGGSRFQDEAGRQAYHDRDEAVQADTLFTAGHTHETFLRHLRRLNRELGWDHTLRIHHSPISQNPLLARAQLWSAFFAGSHMIWAGSTTSDPQDQASESTTPFTREVLEAFWRLGKTFRW